MNLKRVLLYLFTGFCTGGMVLAMFEKMGLRTASYGGEILFVPCVVLCVWFGWTLKTETQKIFRRDKNGSSRRK